MRCERGSAERRKTRNAYVKGAAIASRRVGSLHTRAWENHATGQKRFKTVVRADEVLFLDARERAQDEAEAVEELVEDLPF